jgi:hypothetical protein
LASSVAEQPLEGFSGFAAAGLAHSALLLQLARG